MRKLKTVFLTGMLIFLLGLGGCGSNPADMQDAASSTESAATEESTAAEEVIAAEESTAPEDITASEEDKVSVKSEEGTSITEEAEHGEIISITMAEMNEKLAAGESFLISFVTTQCPYCHDFHDLLVDYIQKNVITMYQVILDYEETPEEENRALVKEIFEEFSTVPAVFYVENGQNASYLDFYNLGISTEVFDNWVTELGLK